MGALAKLLDCVDDLGLAEPPCPHPRHPSPLARVNPDSLLRGGSRAEGHVFQAPRGRCARAQWVDSYRGKGTSMTVS